MRQIDLDPSQARAPGFAIGRFPGTVLPSRIGQVRRDLRQRLGSRGDGRHITAFKFALRWHATRPTLVRGAGHLHKEFQFQPSQFRAKVRTVTISAIRQHRSRVNPILPRLLPAARRRFAAWWQRPLPWARRPPRSVADPRSISAANTIGLPQGRPPRHH